MDDKRFVQVNLMETRTKQTNICLRMAARLGFLFRGLKIIVRSAADSESGRLQTLGVLLDYLLVRHSNWWKDNSHIHSQSGSKLISYYRMS